jgi:multiple sugar transport system substrate-binding protein
MRMRWTQRQRQAGRWPARARVTAGSVTVAVLAAGFVAGCGSSSGSSSGSKKLSGQTLTVFTQAPTGSGAPEYKAYYAYIAKLFHQQTGSTVSWDYSSSGTQLSQTIESSVATHSGPDVFSVGSSYNGVVYGTHAFHVFTNADWSDLGGRSSFVPRMLTMSGRSASQDIGVPFESIPFVLAYNTSLFAKAGITSPPTTWTQWVSDAQAIQKASPGVSGASFSPQDPYGPWKPVWSYALQAGGNFTSAAGTKATFTSAPVRAALKFYFEQEYKYHIVPAADLTWQAAQETSAFTSGKTGMLAEANDELEPELAGTPAAGHVAFAPMPSVPYGMTARPAGGQAAESIVSGNYYDVASYAKNIPLAMAFIKAATSPQTQLEQFKIFGWLPVTQAGIQEVEKDSPASVPFIKAEEASTPTAFTPAWSYIEDGMLAAIAHIAQQVATTHTYSDSYALSQLQAENTVVQAHLGGS